MLRDANGTAAGRPGHPVSCHAMTGGARPLCHPEQDPEPSADRGRGAEHEGRRERQEEPSARPRRADHRAYGFDFSPIAARYPDIMRLVEEARAARRWSPVPDQDGLVSGGSPCSLVVPSALPSLWHATGSAPALPLRASAGPQALRKTNSGRSMPDRRRHRIRGHRGPGRGSDPHCGPDGGGSRAPCVRGWHFAGRIVCAIPSADRHAAGQGQQVDAAALAGLRVIAQEPDGRAGAAARRRMGPESLPFAAGHGPRRTGPSGHRR